MCVRSIDLKALDYYWGFFYFQCDNGMTVVSQINPVIRAVQFFGEQGIIRGHLLLWGSPDVTDCYGTYFSRDKKPNLGVFFKGEFIPVRMTYEHGQSGEIKRTVVGLITRVWEDEIGMAFEAELDTNSPHYSTIRQEIKSRELFISSGSAEHLAEFAEDGRFSDWLLSEVALTKQPCETRMTHVELIRSQPVAQREAVISDGAAEATTGNARGDCGCEGGGSPQGKATTIRNKVMNLQEIAQALGLDPNATVQEVVQALMAKFGGEPEAVPETMSQDAALLEAARSLFAKLGTTTPTVAAPVVQRSAAEDELSRLRRENELLRASSTETRDVPTPPRRATPQISVSEPLRYAHLTHSDLYFGHMILRSRGQQPSEEYRRVMGGRTERAIERGDKYLSDPVVRSLFPSTRANEVAISTAAGGGDEWVAVAWSSQIWEVARENQIYEDLVSRGMRVEEVPQGHESIYIMTEGADPTVYTLSQDADLASGRPDVNVAATRIGTGRVLLTPGELGMAVVYSDVFEEDSLVPVLAQYNRQMQIKASETVEQLFINGDTETGASTNINLIDNTPGTGLSTPYYIASDGALKYALVTGSGTSRDGSTLNESDFRLTNKLMPSAIRGRFANQVYIIDPDTHSAALDIAAIKTDDVRRTNATVTSGVVQNIYGVDVKISGFMPLANSAGKVPAAGGTLGRILNVYAPYWAAGWKRKIKVEADRDILSGTNIIVAKMRLGFKARGAGCATVTYNLTV
jgi:hypothetical protein